MMSRFQQPVGMNPYRAKRLSNFYNNQGYNHEGGIKNRMPSSHENKGRYTPNGRMMRNDQYKNYVAEGKGKRSSMQPKITGYASNQGRNNHLKFYNNKMKYASNNPRVKVNPYRSPQPNKAKPQTEKKPSQYRNPYRPQTTPYKNTAGGQRQNIKGNSGFRKIQPSTVQKQKNQGRLQSRKAKTANQPKRPRNQDPRSVRPTKKKTPANKVRQDRSSLAGSRMKNSNPQNFTFGKMKASDMMKQRPSQLADYSSRSAGKRDRSFEGKRKRRHTTGATKKNVNYEVTKSHESSKGIVRSFGICTTQGIVRNYNEDRVSVILNVTRDADEKNGYSSAGGRPNNANCSFFSVIDGHGGSNCANFLREKLHHAVLNNKNFPHKCPEALKKGINQIETDFLKMAEKGNENNVDRSGACVLIALFKDNECFLANVGDCRAVLSSKRGQKHSELTTDHKPGSPAESKRIVAAGGYVYQTPIPKYLDNKGNPSKGPQRVMPGKLSVSRTIGDILAKDPKYGGNPKVVIPTPDIFLLNVKPTDDFVVLGTDGIYDVLSSKEVIQISWNIINQNLGIDIHEISKKCAEGVVIAAMERKANDNLTCLFVGLPNLLNFVQKHQGQQRRF